MIHSAITKGLTLSSSTAKSSILSSISSFLNRNIHQLNNASDHVTDHLTNHSSSASYHVSSGGYMRGAVFWEPNKPLTIEEFHLPRPKAGEILVKTKGNFSFLIEINYEFVFNWL